MVVSDSQGFIPHYGQTILNNYSIKITLYAKLPKTQHLHQPTNQEILPQMLSAKHYHTHFLHQVLKNTETFFSA
jgi:hypothetical protein